MLVKAVKGIIGQELLGVREGEYYFYSDTSLSSNDGVAYQILDVIEKKFLTLKYSKLIRELLYPGNLYA